MDRLTPGQWMQGAGITVIMAAGSIGSNESGLWLAAGMIGFGAALLLVGRLME